MEKESMNITASRCCACHDWYNIRYFLRSAFFFYLEKSSSGTLIREILLGSVRKSVLVWISNIYGCIYLYLIFKLEGNGMGLVEIEDHCRIKLISCTWVLNTGCPIVTEGMSSKNFRLEGLWKFEDWKSKFFRSFFFWPRYPMKKWYCLEVQ